MSTRHVWEKRNVFRNWKSDGEISEYKWNHTGSLTSSTIIGYVASDANLRTDTWKADLVNPIPLYYGSFQRADTYVYFARLQTGNDVVAISPSGTSRKYWYGAGWSNPLMAGVKITDSDTATTPNYSFVTYSVHKSASTLIGNVSSASSSAYPTNSGGGVSGSYWYVYKGSDNIDPTAVTYPTEEFRPGDKITVSVTPRSNTYGGTISYLYQYSVNGGSWTTIQTTTATSVSFTVPANAQSIQFRARAQDDMGFTSTTYITGAVAGVERLNLWVGVSGRARKGTELYIGVNGKARKVTAAYIGVNGKARRFL